jgi:TM2 domain-containing membrane protein YozV
MDPIEHYYDDDFGEVRATRRAPIPGLSAVLSVLIPGLGQVYNGRLGAGLVWFLAASFGYWAVLVPGFFIHALSVWCAYRGAIDWRGYS